MRKSIKNMLLIALMILVSGCSSLNNLGLGNSSSSKINNSLPVVDSQSIRSISDIRAVALEWKGFDISGIYGYYIFRSNYKKDGQKFTKIAKLNSKYASHYLDTNLNEQTTYLYSISSIGKDDTQSKLSKPIKVTTLNKFDSVSFSLAVGNLPRTIKILWRPHTNYSVNAYIIERSDSKNPKWKKIAKVHHRLNAEYIDTNLQDNHTYSYRIKALTFDNIQSKYSKIIQAKTKPLPKTTSKIQATTNIARKIILTWQTLDDKDIVSYNIYSSRSKNGYFTKLANIKKSNNTFEDVLNTNNTTRYYKITAIDKDNLETNKNTLPVVMGKTLSIPKTPKITLGLIKNNTVIINWLEGDNRAISYIMYKTAKESFFKSKLTVINNIHGNRFEDSKIIRGIDYEYKLVAVDENGLLSKKTKSILLNMPKLKIK